MSLFKNSKIRSFSFLIILIIIKLSCNICLCQENSEQNVDQQQENTEQNIKVDQHDENTEQSINKDQQEELEVTESKESSEEKEIEKKEEEEEEIIEFLQDVNSSKLQQLIMKKKYMLSIFYYTGKECKICSQILDIVKEPVLKEFLDEHEMNVVKINVEQNFELFKTLGFKVLPGVLLSIKGYKPIVYEGEKTSKDITFWLQKIIHPRVRVLISMEEVEKFKKSTDVTIVEYSYTMSYAVEQSVPKNKHILYAFCKVEECLKENNPALLEFITINKEMIERAENEKETEEEKKLLKKELRRLTVLKVYKSFDEGESVLKECVSAKIVDEFIDGSAFPEIMTVNEVNIERAFSKGKKTLILLDDEKRLNFQVMEFVSPKIKQYELNLVYCDLTQPYATGLMDQLGVSIKHLPLAVLAQMGTTDNGEDFKIFKMKAEDHREFNDNGKWLEYVEPTFEKITVNSVVKFVHNWKYDQIKPEKRSDGVINMESQAHRNVKEIVSYNFNEIALEKEKCVIVEFFSEDCKHCQEFEKTYEEYGRLLLSNKELLVTKLNVKRSIVAIPLKSIPAIAVFNKGYKRMFLYNKDRNLEDLIEFTHNHCGVLIDIDDEDL
jgi:thioredoxin-like negative regulator of GroEL